MGVIDADSLEAYQAAIASTPHSIGYFWATWCEPTSFLDAALTTLSASAPDVTVVRVEAEEVPEVTEEADVTAVPTFVMYAAGKPTGERVEGPKIAEVSAWVLAKHRGGEAQGEAQGETQGEAKGKLESAPGALSSLPGLVAPGGAPPPPTMTPAPASSAGSAYATESALRALTRRSPVMLFMKGSPSAPRCGFSRRTAQALTDAGVEFGSFDILSDETVRQGLKKLSDWPTFPQLYVQGQLVGGCDIVEELASTDTLKQEIADMLRDADGAAGGLQDVADAHDGKTQPETTGNGGKVSIELAKRIRKILESAPVVLFMKGSPSAPRCGFSRKVVEALRSASIEFESFDILSDEEIRQGLKAYSDWPTYPQLYVNSQLVGGCDIILEMQSDGSLKTSIQEMIAQA